MKKKRSKELDLKKGGMVYLLIKNIKTKRSSTKLDYKKMGPFKIKSKKGPMTFELELPPSMGKVHLVFYVSLLEPYYNSNIILDFIEINDETSDVSDVKPNDAQCRLGDDH